MNRRTFGALFSSLVLSGCSEHPVSPLQGRIAELELKTKSSGREGTILRINGEGVEVTLPPFVEAEVDSTPREGYVRFLGQIIGAYEARQTELGSRVVLRPLSSNGPLIDEAGALVESKGSPKAYATPPQFLSSMLPRDAIEFQYTPVLRELTGLSTVIRSGEIREKRIDEPSGTPNVAIEHRLFGGSSGVTVHYQSSTDVYGSMSVGEEVLFSVEHSDEKPVLASLAPDEDGVL